MAFFSGNDAAISSTDGWTKKSSPVRREHRFSTVTLRNIPTRNELIKEGWKPGPPEALGLRFIQNRQSVCSQSVCRRCGRSNMHYRPWHRSNWFWHDTFIEFAICAACDFVEELR